MRSHSTPESAPNLEITKLAIVETAISVVLYIGAGVYLGTFQYFALAVLVAPLMLLRTEKSTVWRLEVYERSTRAAREYLKVKRRAKEDLRLSTMLGQLLSLLLCLIALPAAGVCIRVMATVYCVLRNPLWTLRQTPKNWLRQTFCTDFFHPPEIVPGEVFKSGELITFRELIEIVREKPGSMVKVSWFIFLALPGF